MSYDFNKLNKGANGVRPENIDTDDFEFVKLSEYVGKTVPVVGFFYTNGDYGKQVVIITDDCLVNMPARAVEDFEEIEADPDARASVLAGDLVLTDIEIKKTKRGRDTTIYKFANADKVGKKK